MNKRFYHLCGALLGEGSTILPGSYGHIVKHVYGNNKNFSLGSPQMLYYEEKLEHYRTMHFHDKPSRFQCVFVCHTKVNLERFRQYSQRNFQFGYEVEALGIIDKVHYANWEKYDNRWMSANNWREEMENSVRLYWEEDNQRLINDPNAPLEILMPNKLKVIQRIF